MKYVIFDRSIFHGEKFERILASPLLDLARKSRIRIYYTAQFIEETLRYGLVPKNELSKQLEFLFDLNSIYWFAWPRHIVEAEFSGTYRNGIYYLKSDEEIMKSISGSYALGSGELAKQELSTALALIEMEWKGQNVVRDARLRARLEVPKQNYDFDQYFEKNVEFFIEQVLMKEHLSSSEYLSRWQRNRGMLFFTEHYLKAVSSILLLPVRDHSLPVDTNDLWDATQLAHLGWADMMVSDDTKFMKSAFDLLFPGTRKAFLSLDQFLEFIRGL
ncbi:MAG TPA: hypothetical protein VKS81_04935 [Bacteroidota bacterium]|nr:hypothetical protein [Bacteroidota bacterium]